MDGDLFQGIGELINKEWAAVSGATRDSLVQVNTQAMGSGEVLATGLRDAPMRAAADNIQYIQDDSMKGITHLDSQEQTGQFVGNLMTNAVYANQATMGGVTSGGMTA